MASRWIELKGLAIRLRKNGRSIKSINKELGIPLSTLSGWLRDVKLSEEQIKNLRDQHRKGLVKSRIFAAEWHREQKRKRQALALAQANQTFSTIESNNQVLELSLAMLYLGEGTKSQATALGSSDPMMLRFFLSALKRLYGIGPENCRFDLHLRMDQNSDDLKRYWSEALKAPISRFTYVSFDPRTKGRPTFEEYKGVCNIQCARIDIQRKLVYLYSLYCDKIIGEEGT
jgi:hypothetical protein